MVGMTRQTIVIIKWSAIGRSDTITEFRDICLHYTVQNVYFILLAGAYFACKSY
jgi:hypothetical protein